MGCDLHHVSFCDWVEDKFGFCTENYYELLSSLLCINPKKGREEFAIPTQTKFFSLSFPFYATHEKLQFKLGNAGITVSFTTLNPLM